MGLRLRRVPRRGAALMHGDAGARNLPSPTAPLTRGERGNGPCFSFSGFPAGDRTPAPRRPSGLRSARQRRRGARSLRPGHCGRPPSPTAARACLPLPARLTVGAPPGVGLRRPECGYLRTAPLVPAPRPPQLFPLSPSSHVRVRRAGRRLGISKGLSEEASESWVSAAGPRHSC